MCISFCHCATITRVEAGSILLPIQAFLTYLCLRYKLIVKVPPFNCRLQSLEMFWSLV
jgi:hypothetical protein